MKNYENDGNLNYDDLSGGDFGEVKGYGPCTWDNSDCSCYQTELQRRYWTAVNNSDYTIQINIINIWVNRWPGTRPQSLPNIESVVFSTTGSTRPDNYRSVGTVFGGIVGNIIGGLIEDRDRHKPSGILFTSVKRHPLSFQSFWQTASFNRIPGTDKVDFHDDEIICASKSQLNELKSKIGNIVEVWEFTTFTAKNRPSKEGEFRDTVQNLLDRNSEGRDVNGHYTI
jgi:hypothetical protein